MFKLNEITPMQAMNLSDEALALMCEALAIEYGMSSSNQPLYRETMILVAAANQALSLAIDLLAGDREQELDYRLARFQCAVAEYQLARAPKIPARDTIERIDGFFVRLGA